MAHRTLPDAAYLHQCLSYDTEAGTLTWRLRPHAHFRTEGEHKRWNGRYSGKAAGSINNTGGYVYLSLRLSKQTKKQFYVSHRIIWKIMTGEDPPHEVDHINRVPDDNRWANLRLVTTAENNKNKGNYSNNKSGFKGVTATRKQTHSHPYLARIRINGTLIHLGHFSTAEEAHKMYSSAAKIFFRRF